MRQNESLGEPNRDRPAARVAAPHLAAGSAAGPRSRLGATGRRQFASRPLPLAADARYTGPTWPV